MDGHTRTHADYIHHNDLMIYIIFTYILSNHFSYKLVSLRNIPVWASFLTFV